MCAEVCGYFCDVDPMKNGFSYRFRVKIWSVILDIVVFLILQLGRLDKKKLREDARVSILLTGSFYSQNWLTAHLLPLSRSSRVKSIVLVSDTAEIHGEKIETISPPRWTRRVFGGTLARLIYFSYVAVKLRPDIIGGFHLLFNAIVAMLLANLTRARSLYFCVGGLTESLVLGKTENRVFKFLKKPESALTNALCTAVNQADQVITMGKGARDFFIEHGASPDRINVVSGSIGEEIMESAPLSNRTYDVVLVARLTPVKRPAMFLESIQVLARRRQGFNALVVGGGPLLDESKALADEMGIGDRLRFVGEQENVSLWLDQSKVFALTSRSEGLSLAMLEAMARGLPVVVPDVGDLGDVIESGVNGYLIEDQSAKGFAKAYEAIIEDEAQWNRLSKSAQQTAQLYVTSNISNRWTDTLEKLLRRQ